MILCCLVRFGANGVNHNGLVVEDTTRVQLGNVYD